MRQRLSRAPWWGGPAGGQNDAIGGSVHRMLRKRRAAKAKAQLDEELTFPAEEPPPEALSAERFTLTTMCPCGHTRKDHMGLRMEVKGRCLECDCEEFTRACETWGHEQMMERIQAALARVERL